MHAMINQTALLSQQGYLLKSNDHSASTIINQQLKPNRTTKAPLPSQGFESEVTKNKEKEKKYKKVANPPLQPFQPPLVFF